MRICSSLLMTVLEVTAIFILFLGFYKGFLWKKWKAVLLLSVMVIEGAVTNYYAVPFRLLLNIFVIVLLLVTIYGMSSIQCFFMTSVVILLLFTLESLEIMILQLFNLTESLPLLVIVGIINIGIAYAIAKYTPFRKVIYIYNLKGVATTISITTIIIPITLFTSLWDYDKNKGLEYMPYIFTAIIIWVLVTIIIFLELFKMKEKKEVTRIYNEYAPMLESLIDDVVIKQREYENHIQTLYNIAELDYNKKIIDYINGLAISNRKSDKYLMINNVIVGALLYSKHLELENKKIKFDFNGNTTLPSYPLEDYEILEVLSALIDHARNSVQSSKIEAKAIKVNMHEINDKKIISVSYNGKPLEKEQIKRMFSYSSSNSTQSRNKGYGLYDVKKIIKNYRGFIDVTSTVEETTITIIID